MDRSTEVRCHVLTGLGGVGKTQLAAEFAEHAWRNGAVDLLMWVTASSRVAVLTAYSRAVAELTGTESADPVEGATRFLAWLAEPHDRRWLIVLDDLATSGDLAGLWPPTVAGGRALVTTRRRDAALAGESRRILDVGLFTPDEALRYLGEKLGRDPARLDEPEQLAADLGYLPLALAQAAAYLTDRGLTCAGYRQRFAERKRKLAELVPEAEALPDSQAATIAVTWSLSVEAADRLNPAGSARPLLYVASFLNPNGIPLAVFAAAASVAYVRGNGPEPTAHDILDGLHNLRRLSLLTLDSDEVRVHALVGRATRDTLPPARAQATARTAADALSWVWRSSNPTLATEEALRANAETLLDCSGDSLWRPRAHPVVFLVGDSLNSQGHVHAAASYWTDAHATARRMLGNDHPDTLSIRHNLAGSQGQAGDHAGAAATYTALLLDDQRVHGADHPEVLRTRANLAYWQGLAGDPVGAVTALAELLADQIRVLGPDHETTLLTRHSLARMLSEGGDEARAIVEYENLLPEQNRILGPEHPQTIATRNNLAVLRLQEGGSGDAASDLQQVLADSIRILGANHPDTLATRSAVNVLRHPSDPEPHQRLLADCENVVGPNHPLTLRARANLARAYGYGGDPRRAAATFDAVARGCASVLGPDHQHTLTARHNAAHWLEAAGDEAGAADAFRRLLDDFVRVLGPAHPHTKAVEQRLATARAGDAQREILGILHGAGFDVDLMLTDPLAYWEREHANVIRELGPDDPITQLIGLRLVQLRTQPGTP